MNKLDMFKKYLENSIYNLIGRNKTPNKNAWGTPKKNYPVVIHEKKHNYDFDLIDSNIKDFTFSTNDINPEEIYQLYLKNNNLDNLKYIERFSRLRNLCIVNNSLTNVDNIPTQLIYLDLTKNNIEYFFSEGLIGCIINDDLDFLILSHNKLKDVRFMDSFPNIVTLYIDDNSIEDIDALYDKTKLIFLDISKNKIFDLSPLKKLDNLTHLNCHGNKIENIPLLKKLEYLNISNNPQFTDLNGILSLPKLKGVYLYNIGVEIEDIVMLEEQLRRNKNCKCYY